jgi:hypothetical protein
MMRSLSYENNLVANVICCGVKVNLFFIFLQVDEGFVQK